MEQSDFENRLAKATEEAIAFARRFVIDELPDSCQYILFCIPELRVEYQNDRQEDFTVPLTAAEVTQCLCRREGVPRWIDIGVHSVSSQATLLRLIVCNDFVNSINELNRGEKGPFLLIGPIAGWQYSGVSESNRLHARPEVERIHAGDCFGE